MAWGNKYITQYLLKNDQTKSSSSLVRVMPIQLNMSIDGVNLHATCIKTWFDLAKFHFIHEIKICRINKLD